MLGEISAAPPRRGLVRNCVPSQGEPWRGPLETIFPRRGAHCAVLSLRVRHNKGSNKHGLLPPRYYNSLATARRKLVTDETNAPEY